MCARGIRLLSRNPEQPIKFVWSRVVCERALNACGYIVLYTFCTGVPGRERSVGPGRKAVSKPPTLLLLLLLPLPASPLSKNPPRFAIRLWDEIFVSKLQLRSRAKFLTLLLFFSSSSLLFLFLLLLLLPHRAGPLRRFTIPNYNDYAHLLRGLTFEPPPPFAARSMSRFWERNSGGNSRGDKKQSNNNNTKRRRGEKRRGESESGSRSLPIRVSSYPGSWRRATDSRPWPRRAARFDSPRAIYIQNDPPRAPSWIISRCLSLSLPLLLGQPRESRNSRIAEMPRSRRMNALRVQIYYGEVISKIALYLLPRTMRKRERSRFIFVTHTGIDIFEPSSNNSPWSKPIPFFLLDYYFRYFLPLFSGSKRFCLFSPIRTISRKKREGNDPTPKEKIALRMGNYV